MKKEIALKTHIFGNVKSTFLNNLGVKEDSRGAPEWLSQLSILLLISGS